MLFHYVKNNMGIADKQKLEAVGMGLNNQADKQEKQAAKLDYIAMMTDIDLSDLDEEEEEVLIHE